MLDDDEAALDDVDLFRVLGLALHLLERPAALRTRSVGLGELVHDLDRGRLRLRGGPVPAARCQRRSPAHPRLAGGAADDALNSARLRCTISSFRNSSSRCAVTADPPRSKEGGEFGEEGPDLGVEFLVLPLKRVRARARRYRRALCLRGTAPACCLAGRSIGGLAVIATGRSAGPAGGRSHCVGVGSDTPISRASPGHGPGVPGQACPPRVAELRHGVGGSGHPSRHLLGVVCNDGRSRGQLPDGESRGGTLRSCGSPVRAIRFPLLKRRAIPASAKDRRATSRSPPRARCSQPAAGSRRDRRHPPDKGPRVRSPSSRLTSSVRGVEQGSRGSLLPVDGADTGCAA
jgi:hypothetical protein